MTDRTSAFIRWSRVTLALVYLVIVAGSVVRATGSGMGCPDWPKCFGHFIPPTQLAQLQFEEGKAFEKGQFIIWDEALWKAKRSFTTGAYIDPADWQKYTKHDYAAFNVMHTWTEYVNRLMGALLGFASLIMLAAALRVRNHSRALPWLSAVAVFLIGFEAWLGAVVVESNLAPAKITTHMLVALVIIGVVMTALFLGSNRAPNHPPPSATFGLKTLVGLAIIATMVQVVLGTQIREQVDHLSKALAPVPRSQWVEQLGPWFEVHRAFAYAIILLNAATVLLLRRRFPGWPSIRTAALMVLALLVLEWGSGVALALFHIPAYIQPAHLILATLVFGFQFWVWLRLGVGRSPIQQPTV